MPGIPLSAPRYVPNPSAEGQIAQAPWLGAQLAARAESAADYARDVAPVDTGDYRDSIGVELELVDGVQAAILRAASEHAVYVEFGTVDTPAFAPLRKGTDAAGLERR